MTLSKPASRPLLQGASATRWEGQALGGGCMGLSGHPGILRPTAYAETRAGGGGG